MLFNQPDTPKVSLPVGYLYPMQHILWTHLSDPTQYPSSAIFAQLIAESPYTLQ